MGMRLCVFLVRLFLLFAPVQPSLSNEALGQFHDGRRAFQERRYKAALEHFNRTLALAPDFADGYVGLGMVNIKMQADPGRIWPLFHRALKLDPKNQMAAQNAFMSIVDAGNTSLWHEAHQALETSIFLRVANSLKRAKIECSYSVFNEWPAGVVKTELPSACPSNGAAPVSCNEALGIGYSRHLVELSNVFMEHPSGIMYSEEKCSFYLGTAHGSMKGFPSAPFLFRRAKQTVKYLGQEVGSIIQTSPRNYYHFVTECMPRLLLLLKYAPTSISILVPDTSTMKFVVDTLGLEEEKVLYYAPRPGVRYFFEKLYTVDWRSDKNFQSARDVLFPEPLHSHEMWYRLEGRMPIAQYFGPVTNVYDVVSYFTEQAEGIEADLPDNIVCYMSRNDSNKRVVGGEFRLIESINGTGGKTAMPFIPGRYNLMEQASMMKRCAMMIGPHGAGLTNIIWAKNGAPLVMFPLLNESGATSYYYHLAMVQNRKAVFIDSLRSHRNGNYSEQDTLKSIPRIRTCVRGLLARRLKM